MQSNLTVFTPVTVVNAVPCQIEEDRKNNILSDIQGASGEEGQPAWAQHMAAVEESKWKGLNGGVPPCMSSWLLGKASRVVG
jgi:hypothetical protein